MTRQGAALFAAVFMLSTLMALPAGVPEGGAAGQEVGPITIRPNLLEVELVTLSESSLAVSWVTDVESDSWLEWGTSEELGEKLQDDTDTRYHLMELSGLSPDTKYFYRIGSGTAEWSVDDVTTLKLPGVSGGGDGDAGTGAEPLFSFAVAADTHYSTSRLNTPDGRMQSDSHDICTAMVEELDSRDGLDFVLLLGDLADSGDVEQFQGLAGVLDDLELPHYDLPGNHDKGQSNGTDGMALLGGEPWTGGGGLWGLLDDGGRRVIGLDTATYPYQTPGLATEDQLAFLGASLKEGAPGTSGPAPSFMFSHHPGSTTEEDNPQFNGMENQEDLQEAVAAAMEEGALPMGYFAGHVHRNMLRFANATGELPFIVVAAVVEYPVGYSVVNVYDDGYTLQFRKIPGALEQSETSRQKQRSAYGNPNIDGEFLGELSARSFTVTLGGDGSLIIDYPEGGGSGPGPGPGPISERGPAIVEVRALPAALEVGEATDVVLTATVTDPDGAADVAAVTADAGGLWSGTDPVSLNDDGTGGDTDAGDGVFSVLLEDVVAREAGTFTVALTAVDSTGLRADANITITASEELYGGSESDGDDGGGSTPGFGLFMGLGALAAVAATMVAAGGRRRRS